MTRLHRAALAALLCLLAVLTTVAHSQVITYLHSDVAGNPIAATDSAGALVWKENYRPYGERLNNQTPAGGNRQWFHGKLHSFNRYAYGNNNPYRYTDPDGRSAMVLLTTGIVLYIGATLYVNNPQAREALNRLGRGLTNIFNSEANEPSSSGNGADTPAKSPEQVESDAAVNGLTNGLPNAVDSSGKPKKGQYVNTGGDPIGSFDALPGTIGPNGQKTLTDGSIAGIHPSTTTGLDTIHVSRPPGSQDVKVRCK